MKYRFNPLLMIALIAATASASFAAGFDFTAEFKKQKNQIIGAELIIADPQGDVPVYSRWGHAMLLLVNPALSWDENLVLSLAADVDPEQESGIGFALKGLFGGYPARLSFERLNYAWVEYNLSRQEVLNRTILSLNPQELRALLDQIESWSEDEAQIGNYYFLSNNCASLLSALFENAGLPVAESDIPKHIRGNLMSAGLSFYPELSIPSPTQLFENAAQSLGLDFSSFLMADDLTDIQIAQILRRLSPFEALQIAYMHPRLDLKSRESLKSSDPSALRRYTLSDIYGFKRVSPEFYVKPDGSVSEDRLNSEKDSIFGASTESYQVEVYRTYAGKSEKDRAPMKQAAELIEKDRRFRSIVIGHITESNPNMASAKIVTRSGRAYFNYALGKPGEGSSDRLEEGVSGEMSEEGDLIRFADLSCPLAESRTGLSERCAFISVAGKGRGRDIHVIGFKN